jgi:hypothetical protein
VFHIFNPAGIALKAFCLKVISFFSAALFKNSDSSSWAADDLSVIAANFAL